MQTSTTEKTVDTTTTQAPELPPRAERRSMLARVLVAFNRWFGEIHASALAVSDAVMIFIGFMISYWIRFHTEWFGVPDVIVDIRHTYALVPWLVFIWIFACPTFDIYLYRSGFTWLHLLIKVIGAVLLATAVSLVLNQLSGVQHSRIMIIFGWAFALVLIGLARVIVNLLVLAAHARGVGVMRVAVVGAEPPAAEVVDKMRAHRKLGYDVIGGIVDPPFGTRSFASIGLPVLGSIDNIRRVVRSHAIDQILIALPMSERDRIIRILSEFETDAVSVRILSSVIDRLTRPVEVGEIGDIRLLAIQQHPLASWRGVIKRLMDFTVALVGLVLLSPLLLAIAAAVRLSSPGPILFRQTRVGRDDRPFTMYKFRSMRTDAENDTGPVWAMPNDNRRTKIGTFLRRTSLDELPQLYNILVGQMSLVGPRPERPEFVAEFKKQIPAYLRRHKVKAGLTGWAQANGWRGNTSVEKRIECDLWYIANWSLSLDVEIVLKTIVEIFRAKNAY